jgi:hypothetical protein
VSSALDLKSLPGKRTIASSPKLCMWSDEAGASGRRVVVTNSAIRGFDFTKSGAVKQITIEPVNGIGDDAYYEISNADSPILAIRKRTSAFTARILNGQKTKAFTLEQEKAKEAELAKVAVARVP